MKCFGLLDSMWNEFLPPFFMKLHKIVLTCLFIQKQQISCPIIRNIFSHKFSLGFRLINFPTDLAGFRSDVSVWSDLQQKRLSWIKCIRLKVQGLCSHYHFVHADKQDLIHSSVKEQYYCRIQYFEQYQLFAASVQIL